MTPTKASQSGSAFLTASVIADCKHRVKPNCGRRMVASSEAKPKWRLANKGMVN
jgi:hypothetical protein